MGLIQELVDQIRPDSDFNLMRAPLDRGELCRVIVVKIVLLGKQVVQQILSKHNSLHIVYAAAPHRDKGIFAHPQFRKQNSFAGFYGLLVLLEAVSEGVA